jgi:sugar phosphate isomerase/epimerase
MKIGVMVESFNKGFRVGIERARALGADGVQAYATTGELGFESMTPAKIRETLDFVKSNGLVFSAICGDFGGHGFEDEAENKAKVENSQRVLDIARELECTIVTTHIGTLPAEENAKKETMRKACRELAVYADSIGSSFAVETGPEPAAVLGEFLDSLGAMGVRVNFDPANLVMVVEDDPVKGVETLKKYIVHTHAKDGAHIAAANARGGPSDSRDSGGESDGGSYEELPLGRGDVEWDGYLSALDRIGYKGFLTIERECGDDPEADIILARDFLKAKLAALGIAD